MNNPNIFGIMMKKLDYISFNLQVRAWRDTRWKRNTEQIDEIGARVGVTDVGGDILVDELRETVK